MPASTRPANALGTERPHGGTDGDGPGERTSSPRAARWSRRRWRPGRTHAPWGHVAHGTTPRVPRSARSMRPRSPILLVERALLASLVLYAGTLAAAPLRPVARAIGFTECASATARVAATERAFAAAARAGTVRDAFVAYIADSGAVLGGPGLTRRDDLARSPVRPGMLLWGPEVVFTSAAGDLGFSTGPAESYASAAPDARPNHSHFATIWAQQPDGSYRFLADIGSPHGAPTADMATVAALPTATTSPVADARCASAPATAPASAVAAAAAADSAYAAAAARSWREGAHAYAADARLHHGGHHPLLGRAATDSIASWNAPLAAPAAALGVARSADFAWVRGTYALGPAGAPRESGAFLRVWRHDGTAWRLAVEVLSPSRPPRRAPTDSTKRG